MNNLSSSLYPPLTPHLSILSPHLSLLSPSFLHSVYEEWSRDDTQLSFTHPIHFIITPPNILSSPLSISLS